MHKKTIPRWFSRLPHSAGHAYKIIV